jgi:hypothetical protein
VCYATLQGVGMVEVGQSYDVQNVKGQLNIYGPTVKVTAGPHKFFQENAGASVFTVDINPPTGSCMRDMTHSLSLDSCPIIHYDILVHPPCAPTTYQK